MLLFIFLMAFQNAPKDNAPETATTTIKDTVSLQKTEEREKDKGPLLTAETSIPFLQKFEQENPENKVRVTTKFGSFEITLNRDTPYHRANMIFLAKQKYYNGSLFYRVVNGFIIQGGNSNSKKIAKKRSRIGRYLLPPEFREKYKHRRGAVSMPSSENSNPHKFSSPYEFFVVQAANGAPHLDGSHTVFGYVTKGMSVVDKIAAQKTDEQEWPLANISMTVAIVE